MTPPPRRGPPAPSTAGPDTITASYSGDTVYQGNVGDLEKLELTVLPRERPCHKAGAKAAAWAAPHGDTAPRSDCERDW